MAGGDWSDLPLDVFSSIFSKLSLPQLLRSAAVCVSWSAAVRDLSTRGRCLKFRGQSPWLVLYDNFHGDPSAITFYALDERREYTTPVPDPPISDRLFLGSAHGWIITIDVRLRVHLLNPITGKQIDLPRVLPSEHTHPIRDTAGRLISLVMPIPGKEVQVWRGISFIGSHRCLEQHQLKAILSADPSLADGYTVALMIIQYPYRRIFFTRSGDEKWFDLRNPNSVENMVFHKGKLYLSAYSEVYVCDLDQAQIEQDEMPRFRVIDRAPHRDDRHYLLQTPLGDLLSIWRKRNENLSTTMTVKVYRGKRLETAIDLGEFVISLGGDRVVVVADKEKLSIRLEEAKDLGDFIVFLGGRNPLCLSASDFPHLTPNSIYITDDDIIRDPGFASYCRRMSKERNMRKFYAYYQPMLSERNWFRKILNCPIAIDKTFVRLYWQPPSSSVSKYDDKR